MTRSVSLRLGLLSLQALTLAEVVGAETATSPAGVELIIHCYLNDGANGSLGWRFPAGLLNGAGPVEERQLSVDNSLWLSLEREARRQGVSTERLFEHAALYFAAGFDAGRITESVPDSG